MKNQASRPSGMGRVLRIMMGMLIPILLLMSTLAHAQSYAGSVRGTVTDPSGASVPGATVSLRDLGTNATAHATTTDQGVFSFPIVNVG
jgi:hypothetical protein